jgi:hypothetical protein
VGGVFSRMFRAGKAAGFCCLNHILFACDAKMLLVCSAPGREIDLALMRKGLWTASEVLAGFVELCK